MYICKEGQNKTKKTYIDAAGGLFFVIKDFGNDNKTSIVGYIDKEALSYKSLYEQLRLEQFMYVQITRHRYCTVQAVLRTKILGYPEHF